ncbi:hypothetical protein AAHB37_18305 [Glutamicibacter halophytocola]|uniref:hypothetical protein n=1 Tax=Glutamicibacter halophytocola TaxID=1933880 RepID=UPI00321A412A
MQFPGVDRLLDLGHHGVQRTAERRNQDEGANENSCVEMQAQQQLPKPALARWAGPLG